MSARGENPERTPYAPPEAAGKPQSARKHPEEWAADLNPDRMAGQNIGPVSAELEHGLRTAYDVKNLHRRLSEEFSDDELRTIPVIPDGQRLQQGGVYIDLNDPRRREFTATGDMAAGPRNLYTSKSEVPYPIWNRLMQGAAARTSQTRRAANG